MAEVYAIASGKRGVGKSVTATTLGRVLADAGRDVLLVDFDLTRPDLAAYADLATASPTIHDVLRAEATLREATCVERDGPSVVPGSPATDVATVDPAGLHTLTDGFDAFDIVFLDTGRPTAPDTGVATDVADEVIVVSTPGRLARHDTPRLLDRMENRGDTFLGTVLTHVDDGAAVKTEVDPRHLLARIPTFDGDAPGPWVVDGEPIHPASVAYRRLAVAVTELTPDDLGVETVGRAGSDSSPTEATPDAEMPVPTVLAEGPPAVPPIRESPTPSSPIGRENLETDGGSERPAGDGTDADSDRSQVSDPPATEQSFAAAETTRRRDS
jgi:MinD-like ATPase involved in chromosome partitioning or flagellar assembly